jgi:hypothetical protein
MHFCLPLATVHRRKVPQQRRQNAFASPKASSATRGSEKEAAVVRGEEEAAAARR